MTASYFGHTDVVDFLLTLPNVDVNAEDQVPRRLLVTDVLLSIDLPP